MIVSKTWLSDYIDLSMPKDELTDRLTITGLNLEGMEQVGGDTAIDLEVTSNRPDCLGHIGVAREVSVLFGGALRKPNPQPPATGGLVTERAQVAIESPELCPRYTARVLRGVKIGPSPDWLADRLRTIGIAVVNNVVDVTNYVMMEIGQPLHAFDLAKIQGNRILVRKAIAGEEFVAIDHKTYSLSGEEVVVADAEGPIALGGVMGGARTEVSNESVDLLIEAADFDNLAVRSAARRHILFSPSSYRFERGVDPEGIDWASRRCCELILKLAGGSLCEGVIDVGTSAPAREEIKLRFSQIPRLLGIEIAQAQTRQILSDLGCKETHACEKCVKVVPPTWRADLSREVDLLEEVARIHGYDQIPEDVGVRMAPSHRTREDLVLERVRQVLTAAGFDEALTLSAVDSEWIEAFRPWTQSPPLATGSSVLRRANALRQSVVPSLLACRRTNETLSNPVIELFEIAKVYLPRQGELPDERRVLALTSGRDFLEVKGILETLFAAIVPNMPWSIVDVEQSLLDVTKSCAIETAGATFAVLGETSQAGRDRFELRGPTTVAEIDLGLLIVAAQLIATTHSLSSFPPVARDLNIVFDESVRWAEIDQIVRSEGGDVLESLTFQDDSYRDAQQLGDGRKSVLFSIQLRKPDDTLTNEQADALRDRIVAKLGSELGGKLRT